MFLKRNLYYCYGLVVVVIELKCCYLFLGFIGKCVELDFVVVCFLFKFFFVGSVVGWKFVEG